MLPAAAWEPSNPWAGNLLQLLFSLAVSPGYQYGCNNHIYPTASPLAVYDMMKDKLRKSVGKSEELFPNCRSHRLVPSKPGTLLCRAKASKFNSLSKPVTYRNYSPSRLTRKRNSDLYNDLKAK